MSGAGTIVGARKDGRELKIPEGGRNRALFDIACGMRGDGYEQDWIRQELLVINQVRCVPPLDAQEVERIARSAAGYPAGKRR